MTETPIAVRFTDELLVRFTKLQEELAKRAVGARVTRSDAVRVCAERGLLALEYDLGLRKKPKR